MSEIRGSTGSRRMDGHLQQAQLALKLSRECTRLQAAFKTQDTAKRKGFLNSSVVVAEIDALTRPPKNLPIDKADVGRLISQHKREGKIEYTPFLNDLKKAKAVVLETSRPGTPSARLEAASPMPSNVHRLVHPQRGSHKLALTSAAGTPPPGTPVHGSTPKATPPPTPPPAKKVVMAPKQAATSPIKTMAAAKAGKAPENYEDVKEFKDELDLHFDNLGHAFRHLDADRKGRLTKDDLLHALISWNLGGDMDAARAKAEHLMEKADTDHEGKVDYAHFVKALAHSHQTHQYFGKNDDETGMCGHVVKPGWVGAHGGGGQVFLNENLEAGKGGIHGDHVHGRKHDALEPGAHSLPMLHTDKKADAQKLHKEVRQIADKINTKYKHMQRAFTDLDVDKSGTISKLEFLEMVKNFNLQIPFEHVMQIIDLCTSNKDGDVSYQEFADHMRRFEGGETGILGTQDQEDYLLSWEAPRGQGVGHSSLHLKRHDVEHHGANVQERVEGHVVGSTHPHTHHGHLTSGECD